ncbi:MAG: PDZ domain-containing protein [Balneolales bacterium]|nr:PDZ domain-containing protein [Balneolales bacterium]
MKALILTVLLFLTGWQTINAQISAKLMRFMDVSDTHIVFVHGGDIWSVEKEGGVAVQVTRSPGEESWPRISPDGSELAFTASYNGNSDIYVMPITGGVPTRVTYNSFSDRMVDWHPDGERLLFASMRENGRSDHPISEVFPNFSTSQFFLVDKNGGLPEKLPIPYGELAAFSPDGNHLAYITKITENFPFKRYRGGLTSDIILFDFENNSAENITNRHANDGKPAWSGDTIYFLSDENENMRINIWAYDTQTQTAEQITDFEDFDISYMSAGNSDLVFEVGGELYLMDLETREYRLVEVKVVSDLSVEMPRSVNVSSRITNMTPSHDGNRVVFEARGELFNVPARDGFVMNMTQSSGAFDQQPAWSPDGSQIAYWSDQSGEYEIWVQGSRGSVPARQVTDIGEGFGYRLHWSPDSKKLAYLNWKNEIRVVDLETGENRLAGHNNWHIWHGGKFRYQIGWSPDSKWIAFTQGLENAHEAIFVYNIEENESRQLTSGFYSDSNPVFSHDGNYLFYQTNRQLNAAYSSLGDATWIYPNSTRIGALSLTVDTPSLLAPKNDEISVEGETEKNSHAAAEETNVQIDFDNIESRLELLPLPAGNIGKMTAVDGKLIYLRLSNTGVTGPPTLMFYDINERKEKAIMNNVNNFEVTANGSSILVSSGNQYGFVSVAPDQRISEPIPTDGLVMNLVPREEWEQIFMDTWRRYRDFFYDPGMQQVDWVEMREHYGSLIKDARTRWDISNLQSNMLSELSAGHTYTFGGDTETVTPKVTGFLGIDWKLDGDKYRIKRIVKPAEWNTEVRSPFDRPGVNVNEGDAILAVNGIPLDPQKDPYAAFEGLGGKTISLTVERGDNTHNVIVTALSMNEESNLRYLEWIENNRKMVDELSDGRLGYVYMSNTAAAGQRELISMYYGQLHKDGFIIDVRFNGGGQLADRFMELLTRPVVYNLHLRHGRDHTQPIKTNTGSMGMLINGWAASGGDALPWAFKVLEAGPIVGERTLGILVGPAISHALIDGGGITVPDARIYDNAGHWFWEGEGVAPDIEIWDDPNILMQGRDPQIERVVEEVLKNLDEDSRRMTPAPPYEDRTARGLQNQNESNK